MTQCKLLYKINNITQKREVLYVMEDEVKKFLLLCQTYEELGLLSLWNEAGEETLEPDGQDALHVFIGTLEDFVFMVKSFQQQFYIKQLSITAGGDPWFTVTKKEPGEFTFTEVVVGGEPKTYYDHETLIKIITDEVIPPGEKAAIIRFESEDEETIALIELQLTLGE